MSLDQGDYAVSESEVKVGLNGTNKTNGMPQFGFGKIAFGDFAGQGVARAQEGCDRIKAASEAGSDTIVMGSHGRTAAAAAMLGSNAYKVLHLTDRPVLVIR